MTPHLPAWIPLLAAAVAIVTSALTEFFAHLRLKTQARLEQETRTKLATLEARLKDQQASTADLRSRQKEYLDALVSGIKSIQEFRDQISGVFQTVDFPLGFDRDSTISLFDKALASIESADQVFSSIAYDDDREPLHQAKHLAIRVRAHVRHALQEDLGADNGANHLDLNLLREANTTLRDHQSRLRDNVQSRLAVTLSELMSNV